MSSIDIDIFCSIKRQMMWNTKPVKKSEMSSSILNREEKYFYVFSSIEKTVIYPLRSKNIKEKKNKKKWNNRKKAGEKSQLKPWNTKSLCSITFTHLCCRLSKSIQEIAQILQHTQFSSAIFFSINFQTELCALEPGMDVMNHPRTPAHGPYNHLNNHLHHHNFHHTDQTKSLQELQNEVGALLEFRDLVIETFPDLKHKMSSSGANSTITGLQSSSIVSRWVRADLFIEMKTSLYFYV